MAVGVEVREGGIVFTLPAGYDDAVDRLEAALDERDSGALTLKAYAERLKRLVAEYPEFIDGHAHLGYALFEQDKSGQHCGLLGEQALPAGEYPPYHYELALLSLREQRYVDAATHLRRGFLANGYIAEVLCGNPDPMPLAIWHSSNFEAPGLAHDYAANGLHLWASTPGALWFLRWLHNHPRVLVERATFLTYRQQLLIVRDLNQRSAIVDQEQVLLEGIDEALAIEIIGDPPRKNDDGTFPWQVPMPEQHAPP